ncbi:MAG: 3-dehydroquinate synthase [Anaerolineae bacterium]
MAIPNEPRSLVITGFMGTGKTTISQLVAAALDRPLVDTDAVIAERAAMSIAEIFAQHGEHAFRALEAEVCAELAGQRGLVVATGGGMLVSPANRSAMLRSAVVICLDAQPETIEARFSNSTGRPLAGQWRELYEKRQPAYATLPYHVATDCRTPEEVTSSLLELLRGILPVESPEGRYDIVVRRGLLCALKDAAANYGLDGRVAVITNTTVAPLLGEALVAALPEASLLTMPDGEQYKSLATVSRLYSLMVDAGLDRGATVLALGGGVVGDTAGFAAATFMRGVRLVQAPTTLLSMVDSSVGGKVGVDLPEGKNLVGSFKQPAWVLVDPDTLKTLPMREIRCGMAEVIKHGLIVDPGLLDEVRALPWNEQGGPEMLPTVGMVNGIADLLARAIRVKIAVVQRDPFEHGERMHLNLGHTFGHAVEQVSGYTWPHGEAVGLGLIAAAMLSERLGLCGPVLVDQVREVTRLAGLPQSLGPLDIEAIYLAMAADKKWRLGKSRFVLLETAGQPKVVEGVAPEDVLSVLAALR